MSDRLDALKETLSALVRVIQSTNPEITLAFKDKPEHRWGWNPVAEGVLASDAGRYRLIIEEVGKGRLSLGLPTESKHRSDCLHVLYVEEGCESRPDTWKADIFMASGSPVLLRKILEEPCGNEADACLNAVGIVFTDVLGYIFTSGRATQSDIVRNIRETFKPPERRPETEGSSRPRRRLACECSPDFR